MIGMGSGGNQVVGAAGSAVGTAIAVATPTILGVSSTTPIFLGMAAGPLGMAVGGIIAAGAAIASALGVGEGCGAPCIQATQIVNQAEVVLKQNLAAYQNGQIDQTTALGNFDQVWNAVQQSCSGIPGNAGINCVADRQRGGKWDWFSYYRDPIANNPAVTQGSMTGAVSGSNGMLFLLGGALLIGLGVVS